MNAKRWQLTGSGDIAEIVMGRSPLGETCRETSAKESSAERETKEEVIRTAIYAQELWKAVLCFCSDDFFGRRQSVVIEAGYLQATNRKN